MDTMHKKRVRPLTSSQNIQTRQVMHARRIIEHTSMHPIRQTLNDLLDIVRLQRVSLVADPRVKDRSEQPNLHLPLRNARQKVQNLQKRQLRHVADLVIRHLRHSRRSFHRSLGFAIVCLRSKVFILVLIASIASINGLVRIASIASIAVINGIAGIAGINGIHGIADLFANFGSASRLRLLQRENHKRAVRSNRTQRPGDGFRDRGFSVSHRDGLDVSEATIEIASDE